MVLQLFFLYCRWCWTNIAWTSDIWGYISGLAFFSRLPWVSDKLVFSRRYPVWMNSKGGIMGWPLKWMDVAFTGKVRLGMSRFRFPLLHGSGRVATYSKSKRIYTSKVWALISKKNQHHDNLVSKEDASFHSNSNKFKSFEVKSGGILRWKRWPRIYLRIEDCSQKSDWSYFFHIKCDIEDTWCIIIAKVVKTRSLLYRKGHEADGEKISPLEKWKDQPFSFD